MTKFLACAAAGVVLGAFFTASPLTLVSLVLAAAVLALAGRGLPAGERRTLTAVLAAALVVRVGIILALVVFGLPTLNDLAVGPLSGDDAYYLGRAIRNRDLLFGFTGGKYDFFVVLDEYGYTSYLQLLQFAQIVFGPTPFSMRLLNAVVFLTGAVLLFRIARPAFGHTAAVSGLVVLLFMPSLLWVSVSLLKESMYFLCTALLLYCCARLARRPGAVVGAGMVVLVAINLWLINDLRRGALLLAASGVALAIVMRLVTMTRARLALAASAVVIALTAVVVQPSMRARALDGVTSAAKIHGGHVFTVGHPYKLLDKEFYKNPAAPAAWNLELTEPQAARFLVRAAISFLVTPWPWEMASRSELALLPEQIVWYVLLLGLPAGLVAGWRRDPVITALLIGFAIPTAAVLALTNGNVGTLLRLRGLVTPYVIWIGIFGLLVMADRVLTQRRQTLPNASTDLALQGPPL